MNYNKEIYEGWTVGAIIEYISGPMDMILTGNSWQAAPTNKKELAALIVDLQPYIKKEVPEVVDYFSKKYNIK